MLQPMQYSTFYTPQFHSLFSKTTNLPGKHGVHPAGTRGLPHGGFYGGYGAHYRGKREAEAEGDAGPREERSYGHGKAAHPGPGKSGYFCMVVGGSAQKMLD